MCSQIREGRKGFSLSQHCSYKQWQDWRENTKDRFGLLLFFFCLPIMFEMLMDEGNPDRISSLQLNKLFTPHLFLLPLPFPALSLFLATRENGPMRSAGALWVGGIQPWVSSLCCCRKKQALHLHRCGFVLLLTQLLW